MTPIDEMLAKVAQVDIGGVSARQAINEMTDLMLLEGSPRSVLIKIILAFLDSIEEPTEEMLRPVVAAARDFYSESGPYPRSKAVWRAMVSELRRGLREDGK